MRIHILGIGGTFMGGVAVLARALGHEVTGSDQKVYPPMSTQLEQQGIELTQGFDDSQLTDDIDGVFQAHGRCLAAVSEGTGGS